MQAMRQFSSHSHAQCLSKNMKPINFACLLHISGPDNYSPRQNRPVNLHFNRKLLFRSIFTLNFEITAKPIYGLEEPMLC